MDRKFELLQNQFHDITISLRQADLIQCSHRWRGNGNRPPYSSIGLIRRGTGTIIVDGKEMKPVQNQLYLLPAHTSQVFFNDGTQPYLKYYCHFNMKLHDTELFDHISVPLCVTPKKPQEAAELFERLISAHKEKSVLSLIKEKQYMMDLVCYYLQCCEESGIVLLENASDVAINKAINHADMNMHRAVSVAEMAEIAGYHPSHFTRLFRKRFGVSPAQFMIQKKAHYAMEQLVNTVKPVTEISESLGFSSQFYFCNFFKKQTGMTPTEYRQVYLRNRLSSVDSE